MKKTATAIAIVLLVLVCAGAGLSLVAAVDSSENILVTIGNKVYYKDAVGLSLTVRHTIKVTDIPNRPLDSYAVIIRPSEKSAEFSYYVDGVPHYFNSSVDLTDAFAPTLHKDHFTIDCTELDYPALLQRLHPDTTIELSSNAVMPTDAFVLTITARQRSLRLHFTLHVGVDSITIDKDTIIWA